MKINVEITVTKRCYFCITDGFSAATSKEIADLFNLDLDLYNKILIEKVIQHSNYIVKDRNKDLMFFLNDVSKETYVERFKEVFASHLTTLALGGD